MYYKDLGYYFGDYKNSALCAQNIETINTARKNAQIALH